MIYKYVVMVVKTIIEIYLKEKLECYIAVHCGFTTVR